MLALSVVLVSASIWMTYQLEQTGSIKALSAATGRIGLILGALWLAWPTLRRPASWLPPGFAMLGVLVMGIVATQPKTVFVIAPLFAGLLTLASILRAFRK